jgi:hypothetical protein
MPIRTPGDLEILLRDWRVELTQREQQVVIGGSLFRGGKCVGMKYGPLKSKLTFAQFETLLIELGVRLPVGARNGDDVRPHEYPTGDIVRPCVPDDDSFCNVTGLPRP